MGGRGRGRWGREPKRYAGRKCSGSEKREGSKCKRCAKSENKENVTQRNRQKWGRQKRGGSRD